MNPEDLLRMIDILHREKDIPKETLFLGLEDAIATAIRKRLGLGEDLVVKIVRTSGEISVEDAEGERDVLYDEYETRVGSLVNGTVQRFDNDALIINLGRTEAYLPREERVRGETFAPGDRIRAIVLEVRKDGPRV